MANQPERPAKSSISASHELVGEWFAGFNVLLWSHWLSQAVLKDQAIHRIPRDVAVRSTPHHIHARLEARRDAEAGP